MNTGLQYWNNRWTSAATPGEGSWSGDAAARELEQAWVLRQLTKTANEGPILDLGCGAAAIFEPTWFGRAIKKLAIERGYLGVDGSMQAVERARKAYPEFRFRVVDLERQFDEKPEGTVLSRRTIQNIDRTKRHALIEKVSQFPHGVILEGSLRGMLLTNQVRRAMGHNPLNEPEWNQFLNEAEVACLLSARRAKLTFPLGVYYGLTRGILNKRDVQEVVTLCLDVIREDPGLEERAMGLICGVSW